MVKIVKEVIAKVATFTMIVGLKIRVRIKGMVVLFVVENVVKY